MMAAAGITVNRNSDVLKSWKAIARYLDCGIRTAQRWERDLALPVRRPRGHARSAVIAVTDELDQWVRTRSVSLVLADISAANLPEAMAKLTEFLKPRVDLTSAILDVKLTLRLGKNGEPEETRKNGNGRIADSA